jgi:hypothetical protein
MTPERDFDRLAKTWLELGPDEAPDRVVAAVLRAAEITPQVHRPFRLPVWRSFAMNRVAQAIGVVAVLAIVVIGSALLLNQRNQPPVGGPTASPSVSPSPSLEASPSTPPASAAAVVLQRSPTNLGCDSMDPGWRSATIHIDPESDVYLEIVNPAFDGTRDRVNVDVWAEVDAPPPASPGTQQFETLAPGTRLAVYWPASFTATNGDTPVILGARGEEVARDGTAAAQLDKLTGVFICASRDAIWVLDYQPQ